jgi:cytosine/adenosine deaminase-related metal-dependent hydrolase
MTTKLVRGKWVIKGSGRKRQPIKDGAVYIEGTEIRDVGPYESLKKKHSFDVELGSDRHIVMPGFVNSHDHGKGLTFLQRGVMDGPLETWLHEFFGKVTFGEDTYQNVLLSCAKQILNGVTSTLLNFYGPVELMDFENYRKDIDAGARACIDSGMRVAFAPHVYDRNRVVYMDDEFLPKFPPALKRYFGFRIFTKKDTEERADNGG